MSNSVPKLTPSQWDELERCFTKPQNTFGRSRARVQNSLASPSLGFVEFVEVDLITECRITPTGKDAVLAYREMLRKKAK